MDTTIEQKLVGKTIGQTIINYYRETGNGRSDIILKPLALDKPAIIIELKKANTRKDIYNKCDEALLQIDNNNYDKELIDEGFDSIIKYGIAFLKKVCLIKKK